MSTTPRVRFTASALGTLEAPGDTRFALEYAHRGDVGELLPLEETPGVINGWRIARVELPNVTGDLEVGMVTRYVPVHPSHYEELPTG